jgi:hypothetical protein
MKVQRVLANDLPAEDWVYDEPIAKISELVEAIEGTRRTWEQRGGRFILRGSIQLRGRDDENIRNVKSKSVDRPLIIMAESIGGARIEGAGPWRFTDVENVWLYGINFEQTTPDDKSSVILEDARRCRIARCDFSTKLRPSSGKYHYLRIGKTDHRNKKTDTNLIDHNKFRDKERSLGCFMVLGGSRSNHIITNTVIERNHFLSHPGGGRNGGEALRVGESSLGGKSFDSKIRYNLFEKCNGDPECISNKSRDNVYENNTFRKNDGSLSFRHGWGITANLNIFEDCQRGIRIHGEDNEVFDNYFKNVPPNDADDQRMVAIIVESGQSGSDPSYRPVKKTNIKNNVIEKTDQGAKRCIRWGSTGRSKEPITTTCIDNKIIVKKGKVFDFKEKVSEVLGSGRRNEIRDNVVYYLSGQEVDTDGLSEAACRKEDVSPERLREISEGFKREGLKPGEVGPSAGLSDYTFEYVMTILR